MPEWASRDRPLTLIPDAAATLFAARNPGIPARGTVAVCDFGGSGSSITLMDAAGDYQPLAPTVRHLDFSGDLIDQALLTAVLANLPSRLLRPVRHLGDRTAEPADRMPQRQSSSRRARSPRWPRDCRAYPAKSGSPETNSTTRSGHR
ncbi:hypothetical protein [Mycobacterium florentinum]|uniref:hypothetical protein n=1 Tax=Mycobacterium florentinum TaxID=292462 RepID=UPI00138D1A0C|nr:hypothetical protein MFLOJ_59140 [Mycobacterium florentinum]